MVVVIARVKFRSQEAWIMTGILGVVCNSDVNSLQLRARHLPRRIRGDNPKKFKKRLTQEENTSGRVKP